jgi:maltooligosyltrehalose trehalohydrolase
VRALTALLLLQPATPLLFQGQEFGASSPFLYFSDNSPEVRQHVARGRAAFLRQFRTIATTESRDLLHPPNSPATLAASKLDFSEREKHAAVYQFHQDLLRIRREDAAISNPDAVAGAVLTETAFVLRFTSRTAGDRLLLVNLGAELYFNPAPEPLLAPMADRGWRVTWSSESPAYGGDGTPALETIENWILPPCAAVVLEPELNTVPAYVRLAENH